MTAVAKPEPKAKQLEPRGSLQFREPIVEIDNGTDEDDKLDSWYSIVRKAISPFVMSFGFRLFGAVLIFVDIIITIVSLFIDQRDHLQSPLGLTSLVIALYFLMDVLLRVYVEGFKQYFTSKLNTVDSVIVVSTLLIDIVYFFSDLGGLDQIPRMVAVFRTLRITILIRVFRLASEKIHLEKVTRRMVSENKRRYTKGGFDLDLTYITARVIAMSFPSSGQQSFYRNPITDVAKFLDTKHENHYKVYNLCSENSYDPKYFHDRVERMFIDDHSVPTLEAMIQFTANVREWMQKDPDNVIAIHCKGGKGRTGTMVGTWLIDNNQFESAQASLDYFAERRTDKRTSSKFQGVETPSQSRYVGYYEIVKNKYNRQLPPEVPLRIKTIKIYAIHGVGKSDGSDLQVEILMDKKVVFNCICATQKNCKLFFDGENDCIVIGLEGCPVIKNDVKVRFDSHSQLPKGYDNCAFFFWFHTSFVENNRLYLPRSELDNLHKRTLWKIYRATFAVELNFTELQ